MMSGRGCGKKYHRYINRGIFYESALPAFDGVLEYKTSTSNQKESFWKAQDFTGYPPHR
jgi:hypothetical protein